MKRIFFVVILICCIMPAFGDDFRVYPELFRLKKITSTIFESPGTQYEFEYDKNGRP